MSLFYQFLIDHIQVVACMFYFERNMLLGHVVLLNDSWNHRGKRYDHAIGLVMARDEFKMLTEKKTTTNQFITGWKESFSIIVL